MNRLLLIPLALGVGYLAGVVYVGARLRGVSAARAQQVATVAALGEKAAEEVAAIDPAGPSLKDACRGKLAAGPRRSIVGLALAVPEGDRPRVEGGPRLAGLVSAMTDGESTYLEESPLDPPESPMGWDLALVKAVSPGDWSRLLENAARKQQYTQQLRYVAVTHFSELQPARASFELGKKGGTYDAGHSRYRTRVVAFPGGATVCEGSGEGRFLQKEVIGRSGSAEGARAALERKLDQAWLEATLVTPLDDLCETGGKDLCFATNLELDGPDW